MIPGRTVYHFFIRSNLAAERQQGNFEHTLIVENTTIFTHRAELTSQVASRLTEYESAQPDKLSWVIEMKVVGRLSKQARQNVLVSDPNVEPAIQTISLRCRRDIYQNWKSFPLIPPLDVVAKA